MAGSVVATLAVVLPSFLIILLVTAVLKTALKNAFVQAVLRGIKPCMIGIILATGLFFWSMYTLNKRTMVTFKYLLVMLCVGLLCFPGRDGHTPLLCKDNSI